METLHRVKITEIPETNYRRRIYVDENGQQQSGMEEFTLYREVQVIRGWARFAHYLIDAVILAGVRMLANYMFKMQQPPSLRNMSEFWAFQLKAMAISTVITVAYYAIFETWFASTPGKMMLGRVVIDEYALKPDGGKIFLRTLARLVPFEAFSCLWPRGWHDTWTKTFVVDKTEAELLWNRLHQAEMQLAMKDADQYRSQQRPGG